MILFHDVPLECINHAAIKYHVPATMIVSVMVVEGGKNGSAQINKNGSVDLGVMQINSIWISLLKKQKLTKHELQFKGCLNVEVGAWRLANEIAEEEGWKGVGNYNSHTPHFNKIYREKVKAEFVHINNIISRDT